MAISPPPQMPEFNQTWRKWLYDIYKSLIGNIAVGGTARAWYSDYAVIDIGDGGAIIENTTNGNVTIGANRYADTGGTNRYIENGYSVLISLLQSDGSFVINTAPTGAAEGAITYTARFRVENDGTTTINGYYVPHVVGVPATATSTGTAGQISYDSSYFYMCTATNTWKRAAIAAW